jgi:hypothetical protein
MAKSTPKYKVGDRITFLGPSKREVITITRLEYDDYKNCWKYWNNMFPDHETYFDDTELDEFIYEEINNTPLARALDEI